MPLLHDGCRNVRNMNYITHVIMCPPVSLNGDTGAIKNELVFFIWDSYCDTRAVFLCVTRSRCFVDPVLHARRCFVGVTPAMR